MFMMAVFRVFAFTYHSISLYCYAPHFLEFAASAAIVAVAFSIQKFINETRRAYALVYKTFIKEFRLPLYERPYVFFHVEFV